MRLKADLLLLLTAVIWGSAFAAQRVAAPFVGPFLFNGSRFLLAVVVLLPFVRLHLKLDRRSLPWVLGAGILLYAASTLQQAGLRYTTAANAGFLTSLYVVLVPMILALAFRQKITWLSWIAALMAVAGSYLLSAAGRLNLAPGDGLEIIGAVVWALHVVVVGKAVQRVDVMQFSIGQYLVAGVLNLLTGLVFEWQTLGGILTTWWLIAYVGIFSVAVGYTLQAIGQKYAPAADAALIMSMEAVFAALFGWLLLGERLGWVQLLGCGLILAAIVLVQIFPRGKTTAGQPQPAPANLN